MVVMEISIFTERKPHYYKSQSETITGGNFSSIQQGDNYLGDDFKS